jgi:hypothetical protein
VRCINCQRPIYEFAGRYFSDLPHSDKWNSQCTPYCTPRPVDLARLRFDTATREFLEAKRELEEAETALTELEAEDTE